MCSISSEVRVSSKQKILERSLFNLFRIFLVFCLSPIEFTFQEVSLTSSSRDFKGEIFPSKIFGVNNRRVFQLMYCIQLHLHARGVGCIATHSFGCSLWFYLTLVFFSVVGVFSSLLLFFLHARRSITGILMLPSYADIQTNIQV